MKISCIIPVHNSERYLASALDSILSQDWPIFEIIVVNDGCTDRSADVLERYADAIKVVEQQHSGVSAARNTGLRHAAGDIIAFLDSDDIWPPGRLKPMAEALAIDPSADVAVGLVEILDERPIKPAARANLDTVHRIVCMGSALVKRGVFTRVGTFDEAMRVAEDTEFIVRARHQGISFKLLDTVSLIYRLHAGNLSGDISRNQSSALEIFRRNLSIRRAP